MPLYDYICDQCGYEWELLQKLNAANPDVCPQCSKTTGIHRRIGKANFQLKGEGWYKTDFKDKP
jgi:putative FmdB family regulatory protein